MNFDITPREAIELHYVVKSYMQNYHRNRQLENERSQDYQVVCILEEKLERMILNALQAPKLNVDPMAAWVKNQKEKIEELKKIGSNVGSNYVEKSNLSEENKSVGNF